MRRGRAALGALVALAIAPACTALLDLPDPAVDPNFGRDGATLPDGALSDGALPDGALPDGALPDGALPDGAPPDAPPTDGGSDGGAQCDGPCMPTLLGAPTNPRYIATDDAYVYVVTGTKDITRIDVNNKATTSFTPANASFLNDLWYAGGRLFFTNKAGGMMHAASYCATPNCTGQFDFVSNTTHPTFGIAVDANSAYITYDETSSNPNNGGIYKAAIPNGSPSRICIVSNPERVAVGGGMVYWISASGQGLNSCSTGGSSPTNNFTGGLEDVSVGGGYVWFVDGQSLWRSQVGVNSANQFSQATNARVVRADGTNVYWLTRDAQNQGALYRCAIGSCNPSMMLPNLNWPYGLAIGTNSVYVTESVGNKVWRVPK